MLISVIIPTFNRASTLMRAIHSVLNQSYQQLELIVVDDGSTDTTKSLLEGVQDPRFRWFRQENQGVSTARNQGLFQAKGEYFALLDSDDEWLPDKLKMQLMQMGDLLVSHTEEIWIRNGVRVNPCKHHQKRGGSVFEAMLPLCAMSPSSILLHRQVWERVGGFDERLIACEDYDLWLRITRVFEVSFVESPQIIKYGGHADQLSRSVMALDRYRIYALIKILTFDLVPEHREAAKAQLERKCRIYQKGCIKHGRLDEVKKIERWMAFGYSSIQSEDLCPL